MLCMRDTSLVALAAVLALSLAAGPRPAGAGVCKNLGLGKQCVTRGDIKKNAVKSSSVADRSLTGSDIRNGSLTSADIQDGGLTGADLKDGGVGGVDIQDGSLAGADFQDGGLSGADVQDGSIAAADLAADAVFARTLVVSPVGDGSDTTANGQALLDAIRFLSGVSPAPGAANPWALRLEPGVYDVGVSSVDLLPYVELAGSGQDVTEITGSVEGNAAGAPGVVNTANNTAVRHVTVTNLGGSISAEVYAINVQGGPVRVSNTTAQAFNALNIAVGLRGLTCGDLIVVGVTATSVAPAGSSFGADLWCSSSVVVDLTAKGDDAGLVSVGNTRVRNSILEGTGSAFRGGGILNIADSQLIGTTSGTMTCIGTYDASLAGVAC